MRRLLRWIGWGCVGLASLVALAVALKSSVERFPRKTDTVWIDGPSDTRIRGETWVKSSMWDESVVFKYIEVAPDGTETPIGEGPNSLDIARARLYEHGDKAELVVLGMIYRRDHAGHWSAFQAADYNFVYRHYASGITRQTGNSWYYAASGINCWISGLDQVNNRLVSACHFPARVHLIFRREAYDAPWVLDHDATFARTPPPDRVEFPTAAQGTLTTLRIEHVGDASALLKASRRLESGLEAAHVRIVARVDFELVGTEATDVAVVAEGYKNRWRVRGGWVDDQGWPVVFWDDHPLGRSEGFTERRGQPWGESWLVESSWHNQQNVLFITYLELRSRQ